MNSNSSQHASPSREKAGPQTQGPQGPALQFVPSQPGQAPATTSFNATAAIPPPGQGQQNILTASQIPPGYGYPPPFQYQPGMIPPPFSPYPPSLGPRGIIPPTIPSIAPPMQPPMQPTPIPVPGNPGLFYIPQTYGQPHALSHPPYVPPQDSEGLEASAPQPEGPPTEPGVAPTPSTPIQEEPFWCFQCQQWHKSKQAQDQAHASPRQKKAQLNAQGSIGTYEGGLAATVSQAVKEAVAAEFASRNMAPRGAYQDHVTKHRQYSNSQYSSRTPIAGPRGQGHEWEGGYGERFRESPRDYGGHYRYGPDHREVSSWQREYRTPYHEQSRSSTPADARAWQDANTDLDPDEIRAETDSMVSAAFSDMTIQDYKRDCRGNNRNTRYKSYEVDESSPEANGSEEDTSLPLKYLPSLCPNISATMKNSRSQLSRVRRQSERPELDGHQARALKPENIKQQQTPRRHRGESLQEGTNHDGIPKQRPHDEKTSRSTQREQSKAERARGEPRVIPSKVSNITSTTAPPSAAEAQAAVLAYAQWYAQTYGVDPSFIMNLQSSMAAIPSAVSSKPQDCHNISPKKTPKRGFSPQLSGASTEAYSVASTANSKAPSEDGTIVYGGSSASESSWEGEDAVKHRGPKHRSNQKSAASSLRGGRTGYSSPASSEYLEPLTRYLQQCQLKAPNKPHLETVAPKTKTTEDVRGEEKKARNGMQPVTPPAMVLPPVGPEVELSPVVLERSRRQYSLILDESSQALKPVTVEQFPPTMKGAGIERCYSNREHEMPPMTEHHSSIPEFAKPEGLTPRTKGKEVKSHSATERIHPKREPTRPNDPILTAQDVRSGNNGQGPAHGDNPTTLPAQPRRPLPKPTVETAPDDSDIRHSEGWTWDTKLGGYVNINPTTPNPSAEKLVVDLRELESDYTQSKSKATQTPCSMSGDAENSVFEFQVERFSDDERPCSGGEYEPGGEGMEYNGDDWEDEEAEEVVPEYASETDSEESYTDEILLELLSDGRYSDVVSGIFSDVDTEVTTFPGADGDRVVGAPRDMRIQSSYETGTSAGVRNQQEGVRSVNGGRVKREGGEGQAGRGSSYERVYSRGCGRGG